MVNKVILVGRLGADPQVKHFEGNRVVCNLNLATNEYFKAADGSLKEVTEWHRLELWDNLARLAEKSLSKGSTIYVEGRIKTDKYTDNQGVEREIKKIRVLSMQLLGNKEKSDSETAKSNNANEGNVYSNPQDINNLLSESDGDLTY